MRIAQALPVWRTVLALLLLCASASCQKADAHRSLLQSDALSNSNGCLDSIPKCEQGACATRNIMGTASWVCLRCRGNYEPVVDSSGQDNIIQCVCPRGFYEPSADASSCVRCDAGSYCSGGEKVANPSSRGSRTECGANLVTRTTGARTAADCVAKKGYAQTSPTVATPCGNSSYAPQYNRLSKCLRCQSGLEESPQSMLLDGERDSKRTVCKVPPGRYMSQGLVRWCPQGFYRTNYTAFDAAVSQTCLACQPGITTEGAGARLATDCSRVMPGYGVSTLNATASSPGQLPTLPMDANTGLPQANLCAIGTYSLGGFCVTCPSGTVTRQMGAIAVEECVVPPGYLIQAGALAQCVEGTYRERWVMASDPAALACTQCGTGISSEPRDLDENPLAANSSLVRATSTSCYIEAGQGMIASGRNMFSATDCPVNTYGVTGKMYGLAAAPCKPCPRNMITDGAARVNSSDACVNPDGFGYASEGASRCAAGFFALKGSRKPCQKCPHGRTTADDVTRQRVFTDCFVSPGYGLVSSTGVSTDGTGYLADGTSLSNDTAAVMTALECLVGYYGPGGTIRSTCVKCPAGSTTDDVAATSAAQCSICLAGYGIQDSQQCTACDFGTYQPGGESKCTKCPAATFYPPVDGVGDRWTSQGTTFFKGASGLESCVPRESQLSPDAGQIYFSAAVLPNITQAVQKDSMADCIATCPQDSCCMVQYALGASGSSGTCYFAAVPWDPTGTNGTKLMYKLPPSTLTSAASLRNKTLSSTVESAAALVNPAEPVQQQQQPQPPAAAVRAKMMASGYYARCALSPDSVASWRNAGIPLDPAAASTFRWGSVPEWDTGKSEADCQRKCDNSVVCWGFLYDADARACMYKGGEDALRSRAFFVMPNMTVISSGAVPGEGAPVIGGGGNSSSGSGSGSSSGSGSGNGTQCTPNQTEAYATCFCASVAQTQTAADVWYADKANNCTGATHCWRIVDTMYSAYQMAAAGTLFNPATGIAEHSANVNCQ